MSTSPEPSPMPEFIDAATPTARELELVERAVAGCAHVTTVLLALASWYEHSVRSTEGAALMRKLAETHADFERRQI